jgi:hypothetical protein
LPLGVSLLDFLPRERKAGMKAGRLRHRVCGRRSTWTTPRATGADLVGPWPGTARSSRCRCARR